MLEEEKFKTKYNTVHSQMNEEEFLDTVSSEDRELYSDIEILSGKSVNKINKFYNYNHTNKNKKYNTVRTRATNAFKKFLDGKIDSGELNEVFERIITSSKAGEYRYTNLLLERLLGKEEDKISLIQDISFKIDESKLINKEDNKDKNDK